MAQGGKDPITAIANAANTLIDGVFTTINKSQEKKLLYQQRLLAAMPNYRDLFADYRTERGYGNLIIIGVLGLILLVAFYAAYKNKKNG